MVSRAFKKEINENKPSIKCKNRTETTNTCILSAVLNKSLKQHPIKTAVVRPPISNLTRFQI